MGLILDGDIGISHLLIPSGRIMALGSTQSLTEMSTMSISWGGGSKVSRFFCRFSGNLRVSGPVQVCAGIALPFCEGSLKPGFCELISLIFEYGASNNFIKIPDTYLHPERAPL